MLSQIKPPFRAEHIGSLLRPKALLDQRAKFARGEIDQAALTRAEDQAIKDALALQERVGLKFATDGEFRRRSYHSFFYRQLGDISIDTVGGAMRRAARPASAAAQPVAMIKSRVRWSKPINVAGFRVHPRQHQARSEDHHPRPLRAAFPRRRSRRAGRRLQGPRPVLGRHRRGLRQGIEGARDAGCRYVQIDETAFAKFGDPEVQAKLEGARRRLERADRQICRRHQPRAARTRRPECRSACICAAATAAASGTPKAATTRSPSGCSTRSTFRSISSNTTRRAPARSRRCGWCRATRPWCSGLVSTKTPAMENKDELKKRVEDATRYLDLDCLAVSPQCGFASLDTGNPITPEVQEQKLRLVVELARDIWGEA